MESGWDVRLAPEAHSAYAASRRLAPHRPPHERLAAPLRRAMVRARQWLLAEQRADGSWEGELEGDTILESEYILLLAFLKRDDEELAHKAARSIIAQQSPDGGWALYPGGPVDISASVKAYFALKLTGHDPSAEFMQRARAAILRHGGADAVNSFTRFYLALLGQISYDQCPEVPPEVVFLPKWFPISLDKVSAWSRPMIVTLSIMSACRPVTDVGLDRGVRELFLRHPADWPATHCPGLESRGLWNWRRFFHGIDRGLKFLRRRGWLPLRKRALAKARAWMVKRFQGSDGLGAIFPPMVWSIIALRALGESDESPELRYCHERLQGLVIEDEQAAWLQPCKSPVWDTALALRALSECGLEPHRPAVHKAVMWLLDRQITRPGDWSATVRAEPGGWCFEHENDCYPDLDDTAMCVMALASQFRPADQGSVPPGLDVVSDPSGQHSPSLRDQIDTLTRATAALERAEKWMLAMQNRDGGWGAFDRDNDREFLCHVPFADHNAMIDPSTPDLAARVLESLGYLGRRVGHPAVDRAIAYLRRTQEADGAWFGRWGVNYIYGAWQAITGLVAVGVPTTDPAVEAAANWLLTCQQPNGGWGETPESYVDPRLRGQGPTTASQTAWAILGLVAAGLHAHPATVRGVRYLLSRQREDGGWDEPEFTGAGFPRVFYLRYHLYPIYFPLLALGRWAQAGAQEAAQGA